MHIIVRVFSCHQSSYKKLHYKKKDVMFYLCTTYQLKKKTNPFLLPLSVHLHLAHIDFYPIFLKECQPSQLCFVYFHQYWREHISHLRKKKQTRGWQLTVTEESGEGNGNHATLVVLLSNKTSKTSFCGLQSQYFAQGGFSLL